MLTVIHGEGDSVNGILLIIDYLLQDSYGCLKPFKVVEFNVQLKTGIVKTSH